MSDRVAEAYTETTSTASSSGDNTVIAAPGAGRRIVYRKIKVVNTTTMAVTVIVKYGSTSKKTAVLAAQVGSGEIFYEEDGVGLPANTALVLNLSAAVAVSYDLEYLTESV